MFLGLQARTVEVLAYHMHMEMTKNNKAQSGSAS